MQPEIPEPWKAFLHRVDKHLDHEVSLHCYGGFVVAMCYGFQRPTADIDFLAVRPSDAVQLLLSIAGKESALKKKYGLYLDYFGMVDHPDGYEGRLTEMFPGSFRHLRLWALDYRLGGSGAAGSGGSPGSGRPFGPFNRSGLVELAIAIRLRKVDGGPAPLKPIGPVARPATLVAHSQNADHARSDHVIEVVGKPTKDLASYALSMDYRRGFRVSQDEPDAPSGFLPKAPSNRRRRLVSVVTSGFKKVGSGARMKLPATQAGRGTPS